MPQHDHEADLDRARRQAHDQGRAEVLPFTGVAGVSFPTTLPTHRAVVAYEQLLMDAQPHLHERARSARDVFDQLFDEHHQADVDLKGVHLRETGRSPRAWLRRLLATRALERSVDDTLVELHAWTVHRDQAGVDVTAAAEELTAVRAWLDQWTQDAARYASERAWRRRPMGDPPLWMRTYPTSRAFIDEDTRRGKPGGGRLRDDEGTDHGSRWTWTDPSTPGVPATLWRVSWLPTTGDLYAVRAADLDAAAERPDEAADTRPVWLLRSLPVHGDEDASDAVADHMETLEHLQDDVPRESLLALVEALEATDWDDVLARAGRG